MMKMSKDMKCSKTTFFIFLGITLFCFIYVILRAEALGFTHDEGLTFTILSWSRAFMFSPNNHWLNTILIYLSGNIFGHSEFSLRLPNVLSFLVYSYFCYKIVVEKSTHFFPSIIVIIFLMLNTCLIDYFSLARGYGLALAFLTGSFFYFLKAVDNSDDNKNLINGIIFSVLTIYSNFTFVFPIIALHLGYLLHVFFKNRKLLFRKERIKLFIIEAAVLFPAFIAIIMLKLRSHLYYGGTRNIIRDTLFSIFSQAFKVRVFDDQKWIILIAIAVMILFGIIIKKQKPLKLLLIVLSTVLLLPIILHYTIGLVYSLGRYALYWIVILGVFFHVFLDNLFETKKRIFAYFFTVVIACITFVSTISFFDNMNLQYTQDWKYSADVGNMLEFLDKNVDRNKKYTLGRHWLFKYTIDYYRQSKNYNWLESPIKVGKKENKDYDYYYGFNGKRSKFDSQKELKRFKNSNTKLIKNCR